MKAEPLKITDLNGYQLEIDNLQLALMQADDYRHYRLTNPTPLSDSLQAHWEDLYQKLLQLQQQHQI